MTFKDLWRWDGTIDRGPYAFIGFLLFALKYNLDRLVAAIAYHRNWELFNYWVPLGRLVRFGLTSAEDRRFLALMLAVSLPFAWTGTVLTLRRLRSTALPAWLVVLFFLPFVNLIFLGVLCLLPARRVPGAAEGTVAGNEWIGRFFPHSFGGSAALAIAITTPVGLVLIFLCVKVVSGYGWSLFVALPFALGMIAALVHGYHEPRTLGSCVVVALAAVSMLGGALIAVAFEGLICVLMAAPIAVTLALLGGIAGFLIQNRTRAPRTAPTVMASLLLIPALAVVERGAAPDPSIFETRTAVVVDAPAKVVWKHVVGFSKIPRPREWFFRAGIAYPMRAEIRGSGPGAVRHCVFSTGDFIEPIEIWEAPRLLKFSVTSCPAPMEEWTPYGHLDAPHLHGFLVSNAGQFLLTRRPDGKTLLEGTTWYRHGLWPESYWRIWSDAIIHRIHARVLRHVRDEAEADWTARKVKSGHDPGGSSSY